MLARTLPVALSLCILPALAVTPVATRQPTPAEQKAIANYSAVLTKVLDQFRGPDWDETIDAAIDHPMMNEVEDRPMDFDQSLQRTYTMRPGSRRDKLVVAPMQARMDRETDTSKKQMIGARTEELKHLRVLVHCNAYVSPLASGPHAKADTIVPGATFAHKDKNNPFSYGSAYVLYFSNMRPGRWDEVNGLYRFKFVHKPNTPYIENIEIRIYGADDRIRQLLRTIDWRQVNKALTTH